MCVWYTSGPNGVLFRCAGDSGGGGVDAKLYLNNILEDNKLRSLIIIIIIAVYVYRDRDDVIIIIIMS